MPASANAHRDPAEGGDKAQQQHRRHAAHANASSSSSALRVQKLVPDSDDDDRKPLFPVPSTNARASTNAKAKTARASTPEVLELSSGSDSELDAQVAAIQAQQDAADAKRAERKQRSNAARELIVAAVPDADEAFLAKAFSRSGHDANKTVDTVLGTNYPLRTGGWKFGKPLRRERVGVESDQDDDDDDSELEVTAPAKKRKVAPAVVADKKKRQSADKGADKAKGKKRARPQSDESEVDQLASDESDVGRSEDDAENEDAIVYTKAEAIDEETYWLDPSAHKAGGDSYRKAAFKQLVYYDYDQATEAQIRKVFEKVGQLYAPAWMALYRKKQLDDLVELRGPARDPLYIHCPDGKVKKRDPGPKSKFLEREMAWLEKYIEVGGCKRKMARDEPDMTYDAKGAAKVQLKPKASTSSSSSSSNHLHQKKKKRAPRADSVDSGDQDDDDELDELLGSGSDDCNSAGWGPEGAAGTFNKRRRNGGAFGRRFGGGGGAGASGAYGVKEEEVEPFSGAGFRLGD
ncbi:hypothetical protein JCM3775_001472 [Rhodotorula graminis]